MQEYQANRLNQRKQISACRIFQHAQGLVRTNCSGAQETVLKRNATLLPTHMRTVILRIRRTILCSAPNLAGPLKTGHRWSPFKTRRRSLAGTKSKKMPATIKKEFKILVPFQKMEPINCRALLEPLSCRDCV